MGKTGFYREKWEKREKLFFFLNKCLKTKINYRQINSETCGQSKLSVKRAHLK